MPFKKPKKGERGEAALYYTRNQALRYLQLKLPEFRKLTVWKGIFPREPKHRKRAQQGDSAIKILYLKDDIKFIAADPMMWKIREDKIHRERVRSLKHTNRQRSHFVKNFRKPNFNLDHMVLERYPKFGDALEDLTDALNACFIYATLPKLHKINQKMIFQCRKLTLEFLTYIIETKCLRQTFISVKGYYFRAHIQGRKVTWLIPHNFTPEVPKGLDMRHMGNFIQFYITLLSFVNFKLFASINLYYPPTVPFNVKKNIEMSMSEQRLNYIWSLNTVLKERFRDDDIKDEKYNLHLLGITGEARRLFHEEQQRHVKQQTLFQNVKFFLGRETNRESLTFVIRCAGGLVSWDPSLGVGFTFKGNHKDIKYEIVDRPSVDKNHLTRYYVQPQWVYDSFNAGMLMPVQDYFVGVELPAHLSPFEETYGDKYVPPEMLRLQAMKNELEIVGDKKRHEIALHLSSSESEEDDDSTDEDENDEKKDENDEKTSRSKENNGVEEKIDDDKEKEDEREERTEGEEEDKPKIVKKKKDPLEQMKVISSKRFKRNKHLEAKYYAIEDFRLRSSFIHRKQKRLFKKILKREMNNKFTKNRLKDKRILYEKDRLRIRKMEFKATRAENIRQQMTENGEKMTENSEQMTENSQQMTEKSSPQPMTIE